MKTENSLDVAIETRNLTKVFRSDLFKSPKTAVRHLNCRFLKGRCTGILGHNGAGKTTTLRMIMGLIRPTEGEILFGGAPIQVSDKTRIGYMPEVSKLPNNLSCREILRNHLALYRPGMFGRIRKELIETKLEEAGILPAIDKRVKNLSKGMARRLAWAQAIIHDPDVVILDEPFSGLDPVARHELLMSIKEYRRKGKTLLVCTHELWSVRELCDEVHIFRRGELAYSTIDPALHQRTSALNTAHFQLVLSGVRVEDLRQLQDGARLKNYDDITHKDLVVRLSFHDYQTACTWLRASLERGFIVLRFADEIAIEDDSIKTYFEGGPLG